jgi:DNA-binding transcriptional LysR family regulator
MFFSYQVEPLVAQKKLRVVLEAFELPPRPISIVYPHARLLPARTRAFIAFAKQEITRFNPQPA